MSIDKIPKDETFTDPSLTSQDDYLALAKPRIQLMRIVFSRNYRFTHNS